MSRSPSLPAVGLRPQRDLDALRKRRRKAAALFVEGVEPAEVAAQLKVSIQAASVWRRRWQQEGEAGLAALAAPGADPG